MAMNTGQTENAVEKFWRDRAGQSIRETLLAREETARWKWRALYALYIALICLAGGVFYACGSARDYAALQRRCSVDHP